MHSGLPTPELIRRVGRYAKPERTRTCLLCAVEKGFSDFYLFPNGTRRRVCEECVASGRNDRSMKCERCGERFLLSSHTFDLCRKTWNRWVCEPCWTKPPEEERICVRCEKKKPITAFQLVSRGQRRRKCKNCVDTEQRERPGAKKLRQEINRRAREKAREGREVEQAPPDWLDTGAAAMLIGVSPSRFKMVNAKEHFPRMSDGSRSFLYDPLPLLVYRAGGFGPYAPDTWLTHEEIAKEFGLTLAGAKNLFYEDRITGWAYDQAGQRRASKPTVEDYYRRMFS